MRTRALEVSNFQTARDSISIIPLDTHRRRSMELEQLQSWHRRALPRRKTGQILSEILGKDCSTSQSPPQQPNAMVEVEFNQ